MKCYIKSSKKKTYVYEKFSNLKKKRVSCTKRNSRCWCCKKSLEFNMKMMNESQMLPCLPSLFTRSEGWMDGWLVGWMGYSCMLRILFSGPIQIRFLIRNGFLTNYFWKMHMSHHSSYVWRRRRSKALEIVARTGGWNRRLPGKFSWKFEILLLRCCRHVCFCNKLHNQTTI